jgi:type IV fimbrial biogenesis protein FimT
MFSQPLRCRVRSRARARSLGFGLIESLVTLGIAGVLVGIAVPSLGQVRDKAAVDSRFHDLGSALRRARSEATTRGDTVTVCALDRDSVATGSPACVESGNDWSAGWLVFVDRGERGEVGEEDHIIAVDQAPAQSGSVLGTQRYLTYRFSGELLGIAAHFRFLPPGTEAVDAALPGSALLCVNKPGKARLSTDGQCRA